MKKIEFYRNLVRPKKRIILCVDGVAGNAKMSQQRQRRFKSAMTSEDLIHDFDPVCLTPGTMIMDFLTKYIDWYVRSMQTIHPEWKDLEIIVSNEKVPGEGEHKIINYMRKYANPNESYCIQGLDADLIMLSLGMMMPKMCILRENIYTRGSFFILNISGFEEKLVEYMKWEGGNKFIRESCINDFIFMCFLVGNDFVPTIPTLAILEGGIDIMIDIYKTIGMHLTYKYNGQIRLHTDGVSTFFKALSDREKDLLQDKQDIREKFFEDKLLNKHTKRDLNGKSVVNMDSYKQAYYDQNFDGDTVVDVCNQYLQGLQWIINYYKIGIPDWKWNYPYFYAPFLSDLSSTMQTFKNKNFEMGVPVEPFMQLLCVLPPQSKNLLPRALQNIPLSSSCKAFYPTDVDVDVSGKRREWEGIVKLPKLSYETVYKEYMSKKPHIDVRELSRNKYGNNFVYTYKPNESYYFNSYYGKIDGCTSCVSVIKF